jgi:hypothetical protein
LISTGTLSELSRLISASTANPCDAVMRSPLAALLRMASSSEAKLSSIGVSRAVTRCPDQLFGQRGQRRAFAT